jgi:DNA-directed RNA polymerase subunit omega
MIEALKSEEVIERVGGRFKLCALIQRRLVQLMEGARPLVDRSGRTDLELVIEEIAQGKIYYDFDPSAEIDTRRVMGEAAVDHHQKQLDGTAD